jgi:hypothetical protein
MFYEMNQAIEKQKPAQFLIEVGLTLLNDGVLLSDLLIVLNAKLAAYKQDSYVSEIRNTYLFFSSRTLN